MMYADSLLRDRKDAAAAQALMQRVAVPEGDARLRRYDRLLADVRQKLDAPPAGTVVP